MKASSILALVVMFLLGMLTAQVSAPLLGFTQPTTVATTLTELTTITKAATSTVATTQARTVTSLSTVVVQPPALPSGLAEMMEEAVPGSTSAQAYHIYLPNDEGTYKYFFAVYWRYRDNLTHVIVFHKKPSTKAFMLSNSLVQTRFAAAWNIPNNQAARAPHANITEVVLSLGGTPTMRSWEIKPTLHGYASKPVSGLGETTVWIVTYQLIDMPEGASDENLVARYYFLEIGVRRM